MPELVRPSLPAKLTVEELRRAIKLTSDNISRVNERLRGWDYTLTHGTELLVEKPVGYTVNKALAVRTYDETLGVEGPPVVGLTVREVTPTTLGITAIYEANHTQPFARLNKAGTQSISSGGAAGTAINWDIGSSSISSDGVISLASSSRVAVSQAGLYLFNGNVAYAGNVTGTRVVMFASNGSATFTGPDGSRGYTQDPAVTLDGSSLAASAMFTLGAGEYVEMFAYQNSGGALNITTTTQLQVARLRNDSAPSYLVTILLLD